MTGLIKSLSILVMAIALGAVGNILLKKGMSSGEPLEGLSSQLFLRMLQPPALAGLIVFGLSSLLYCLVLSREDLSYAYPFVALNYLFVTLLAWRFLGEKVPPVRIVGLAIIILGVLVFSLGRTPPRPAATPAAEAREPAPDPQP
jgi:drug/metabolite transporter (DMT)-like permease